MGEWRAIRLIGWSRAIVWRSWWWVILAWMVAALVLMICLGWGSVPLSPGKLIAALIAPASDLGLIVWQLRLPRTLLGALVGGALALSGWLLQQIMRNALASPDTLGVTSGASASAVSYFAYLAADFGTAGVPLAAASGAIVAVAIVYLMAWQQGATPVRLILTGIGLSVLMAAITTFVLASSPLSTTLSAYVWLTGSVYGGNWSDVSRMALCCLLGGIAIVPLLRFALLAPLDDALAIGIGVRVQLTRALLTLLAAGLAGIAVAWGGAMAFVGLVAPHLARRLIRDPGAAQPVMAVLVGAIMVMMADLAGRTLFSPLDLPAGIFVAAVGAPFFLTLLIRQAS